MSNKAKGGIFLPKNMINNHIKTMGTVLKRKG